MDTDGHGLMHIRVHPCASVAHFTSTSYSILSPARPLHWEGNLPIRRTGEFRSRHYRRGVERGPASPTASPLLWNSLGSPSSQRSIPWSPRTAHRSPSSCHRRIESAFLWNLAE